MFVSLWNLTGILAVVPYKFQSDWKGLNPILRLRASVWSCVKTSATLVNRGSGTCLVFGVYRWLSVRLQYIQCISNGDTAILQYVLDILIAEFDSVTYNFNVVTGYCSIKRIKSGIPYTMNLCLYKYKHFVHAHHYNGICFVLRKSGVHQYMCNKTWAALWRRDIKICRNTENCPRNKMKI